MQAIDAASHCQSGDRRLGTDTLPNQHVFGTFVIQPTGNRNRAEYQGSDPHLT